ncbi:MAG TPA: hypothetical protein VFZ61_27345 [Polyangiales bacterium]
MRTPILIALALGPVAGCDDREPCYSPTQNVDLAEAHLFEGVPARGCPCEETKANMLGYCVEGVALVCDADRWQVMVDGPCFPPQLISELICDAKGGEQLPAPEGFPRHDDRDDEACRDDRELMGVVMYEDRQALCCVPR